MKTIGNLKWKLALSVIGLAVLTGAGLITSGTPVLSAQGTCTITVDIPDELNPLGAKIDYYPWSQYKKDGETFTANRGSKITWKLIVNGFDGKNFVFQVPDADSATLAVGPDAYCTMQVINVPSNGQVNVYPWNTNWVNNQQVIVPVGGSCTWRLKVSGFTGADTYVKNFDCTPLDVTKAVKIVKSYCDMKVQLAQDLIDSGAKVCVYPWNTYWQNNDTITVPISGSCTWKLVVNGFSGYSYTKNFDCSPLVVDSKHYYKMKVINVPAGMKVCVYPWNTYWTDGQEIVVPFGGSCKWKLVGPGAPSTEHVKNFDGTDLNASE